ncbi:unnamed protein product [Dibothriocephalus latus]|uniref:Uncharacterized protein n=1 Tax=Dibothriocephalus latus TaxID=60516 RepID=A0A3P7M2V4_DIBLA|nr:unnamed protein product [Dibothriocephalus latus]
MSAKTIIKNVTADPPGDTEQRDASVVVTDIVMQPNASTYDPQTTLPSLKVCAGPICYSTDLKTKILDRQGTTVLRDGLSNKINLTDLQCRSIVLISTSTDPKHLLPVQMKIGLNPVETFECSEAPRYVPPKPFRLLDLCESESSYTKAVLANATARTRAFANLTCNSNKPGVRFTGLTMHLPEQMEIPSVFEIRCFLHDCRWMFQVNVDRDKLKLIPIKIGNDLVFDAVSLQICRGPKCWAGPFNTSILDTNNHLLRGNLTKEPVSLRGLYCRNEVHLVAQEKDVEAEPVRHTIQLYPVEQLNCSQTDIYITPASATKPIPLCSFTSAQLRDTFDNEDVYNTFFEGIQCTSSVPGTRFTKRHLQLPTDNLSKQNYTIDCKLYGCRWEFRIFKQPESACIVCCCIFLHVHKLWLSLLGQWARGLMNSGSGFKSQIIYC